MANPVRERTNSASAIEISSSPSRSASLTGSTRWAPEVRTSRGRISSSNGMGPEDQGVGDASHVDPERVGGGAGGADGVGQDRDLAPDAVLAQRRDDAQHRRVLQHVAGGVQGHGDTVAARTCAGSRRG